MTILTKPSDIVKKPVGEIIKSPLVDENTCDEEKIEVHPAAGVWPAKKRSSGAAALLCMTLAAALVSLTGVACGLVLYRQYLRASAPHRYQAYCSLPLDDGQASAEALNSKPQFWQGEQPGLFAYVEDPDALNEKVDIDTNAETISVFRNNHQVQIMHDFANNYTGIIDSERCFLLDLDPETVLRPDVFIVSIERGEQFDTSRIQVSLRAAFPAITDMLQRMQTLRDRCLGRPIYKLLPDDEVPIRKRSVEAPQPQYVQFAGKHIQEIDIANIADLEEYEKNLNKA